MLRLYEAQNSWEARLLIDHLEQYQIKAEVFGELLNGAAGELCAMAYPAVWVMNNADLPRAKDLLSDFLQRSERGPLSGPWKCTGCAAEVDAEFEICWQCGRVRNDD